MTRFTREAFESHYLHRAMKLAKILVYKDASLSETFSFLFEEP